MESLLEKISKQLERDLPFVVYHKPGAPLVEAFLQADRTLNLDPDLKGSGFVFAPFDKGDTVLFCTDHSRRLTAPYEALRLTMTTGEETPLTGEESSALKRRHLKLVDDAIHHIEKGKALKLVVSRSEKIEGANNLLRSFQRILSAYPMAFSYLWHHPEIGTWMGATPEVLLQATGRRFKTIALAGTIVDEGGEQPVWGEKEREEQLMVSEHIQKELAGVVLKVSETRTVKAGNLLHLRTDLEGELMPGQSISEVVKKLHPTAAVCGLPREEARRFLMQHEGYDRAYYTGFLGELRLSDQRDDQTDQPDDQTHQRNDQLNRRDDQFEGETRTQLYVNLRCARVLPDMDQAILYVGGGITASSKPEKEWEETVAKSLTMKKVLRDL